MKSRSWEIWATFLLVVVLAWIAVAGGPRNGVDLEMYAGYEKARLHHDVEALLVMDKSLSPEFRMPYLGWPPLYGALLTLGALSGLSYLSAVVVLNVTLVLATLWAARCWLRVAGCEVAAVWLVPLVCLSLAFARGLTMGFCHWLIPGVLIAAVAACEAAVHANSRCRRLVSAVLWGVVCGLANWACYFVVPAVWFAAVLRWRSERRVSADAWPRLVRVTEWCVVAGLCLCSVFALWRVGYHAMMGNEKSLDLALSANAETLRRRMLPGANGYLQAAFYGGVRFAVAVLPVVAALVVGRMANCLRWRRPGPATVAGCLPLWLAPLFFFAVFPGEMAPAAHAFHSLAFLPAAISLLACVEWSRPRRGWPAVAVGGVLSLLACAAYPILPNSWLDTPSFGDRMRRLGYPGDGQAAASPSRKGAADMARTLSKQFFTVPLAVCAERVNGPEAAVRDFAAGVGQDTGESTVVLGWFGDPRLVTYTLHRTFVALERDDDLERVTRALDGAGLTGQRLLLLPGDAPELPVPAGVRVVRTGKPLE